MKMIAAVPCLLLTLATLGCSQQHATAPDAAAPAASAAAPAATETNTFGESKEDAAGSAADARAAHYGSDASAPQAPADGGSAPK